MRTVIVRYKVKPEAAAENEALIKQVFAQLAREQTAGTRYQAMKAADGVSFTHVSTSESKEFNPLTQLESFKAFTAGIKHRVEEGPITVEVEVIGRYDGLG
jgi:hypothetical protein